MIILWLKSIRKVKYRSQIPFNWQSPCYSRHRSSRPYLYDPIITLTRLCGDGMRTWRKGAAGRTTTNNAYMYIGKLPLYLFHNLWQNHFKILFSVNWYCIGIFYQQCQGTLTDLQPPSPLLDAAIIEPLGRYITSASQIVQLLTMS